ncbi:MAG: class I SAM-dependent methyltransferase [bacterium]|nr:class I SAM-dependent methyltransferase [bacterium]
MWTGSDHALPLAIYSIIHIPRELVRDALREFRRILAPGGRLLLSFHLGDDTTHLEEWMGLSADLYH